MTLFFPDVNVWLALSVPSHAHSPVAWSWFGALDTSDKVILSRYSQLGLLRLLTSESAMGDQVLTLREAWQTYDRWLEDPRVDFFPEPPSVESTFRKATKAFAALPASKAIGDCWLLAFAIETQAVLVTFDRALLGHSKKLGHSTVIPA